MATATLFGDFAYGCTGSADIPSPDRELTAHIIQVGGSGCGESRIQIVDSAQQIIASAEYTSTDRERGYGVEKAAWTPDSRFFVYSMSSSGGHQANRFPVFFFARAEKSIQSLETRFTLTVTDPSLAVSAPATVQVFAGDEGWKIDLRDSEP